MDGAGCNQQIRRGCISVIARPTSAADFDAHVNRVRGATGSGRRNHAMTFQLLPDRRPEPVRIRCDKHGFGTPGHRYSTRPGLRASRTRGTPRQVSQGARHPALPLLLCQRFEIGRQPMRRANAIHLNKDMVDDLPVGADAAVFNHEGRKVHRERG